MKKIKFGLEKYEKILKKYNISLINCMDEIYPEQLRLIDNFPISLYAIGNIGLLKNNKIIAIVGSRQCSSYGIKLSKEIACKLSKDNTCIVSGLAKGIDYWAHTGALYGKGKTIAVLGSGIDVIYPSENKTLYKKIITDGGLIITEYIMGTLPISSNFPKRNRIISGISNATIVVEAKEKSGAVITANETLLQNKTLYAIPGNIDNPLSKGCNRLIYDGAIPITDTSFKYGYESLSYGGY